MAAVTKAVITFMDTKRNFSSMTFEGVATRAAMETLQGVLEGYTACNTKRNAFHDISVLSPATPVGANRDRKAIINTQDDVGHVHSWEIPGYNGATTQEKEGERVEDVALTAIVAAIATATGLSLTALESPVIQTR